MKNQEDQQSIKHSLNLLIVGDTQVGKTSVIIRYTHDIFEEVNNNKKITLRCNSLSKNDALKVILFQDQCVQLQINDMSGPEKYIFIDKVIRKAQGILVTYDITNRDSFDSIEQWIIKIDCIVKDEVVKILIGNKCDQEDNRVVTFEEGHSLASQYGIPFFETSAKLSINIENSLLLVTSLILEKQQKQNEILGGDERNQKLIFMENKKSKNIRKCI